MTVTDAQGSVNLDTGSGGVTLTGVHGDELDLDSGSGSVRGGDIDVKTLKADVGSGGLRLTHVKSDRVNADVGSGGLELDLSAPVSDLSVDAGSGGVTLRLAANQGAELDIDTGSGGSNRTSRFRPTACPETTCAARSATGRGESTSTPARATSA